MKLALIIFASILFLILILTYPFKIKVATHINFLKDVGFLAIKFTAIKLFCGRFTITKNGKFEVKNAVKKKKKKKNKEVRKKYFTCLASMISVRKFELFLDAGHESNAYLVSLICGYIGALTMTGVGALMNRYHGMKVFTRINPSYTEYRLELSGSIVLRFTLLHIILSLACAYFCFIKSKVKEKING